MPPEPQNSPKLSPPIFIWALIIVAALIGSIEIWQASLQKVVEVSKPLETTDQFADWKTYRNEEYGFEFKHPTNLEIVERGDKNTLFINAFQYTDKSRNEGYERFSVSIMPRLEGQKYIIPEYDQGDCSWCVSGWTDIKFAGYHGYQIKGGGEGPTYDFIAILRNDLVYLISSTSTIDEFEDVASYEENLNIQQNILATFKFISTSTVETGKSGVKGTVTIGPTCPVMREPPDPNCADKPYQANLVAKNVAGKIVIEFKTNSNGTFKIDLSPGTYTIGNAADGVLPALLPAPVIVGPNEYEEINLQFDSGIR